MPDTRYDIVERDRFRLILGQKKGDDRMQVVIIKGLNGQSFMEMGRLGFLAGQALRLYEEWAKYRKEENE